MTAYQSAIYHDLLERKARDEQLTPQEEQRLQRLWAQAQQEEENEPRAWLYGGDYPDVF